MTRKLEFRVTKKHGIVPFVDGESLRKVLDSRDYIGLVSPGEAAIAARMLQGWVPPEIEVKPEDIVVTGPSIELPGGRAVQPIRTPRVPLVLPGGSNPEIDAAHGDLNVFRGRDGVPVLSCECGSGVGCAAVEVEVSYGDEVVRWRRGKRELKFRRAAYDKAIKGLLVLVGEEPRLINDDPP